MITLSQTVRDIKEVKVQGANQIAVYGLTFLKKFARTHGFGLEFDAAAIQLEHARPTAVVLHNCIKQILSEKKITTIDFLIKTLKTIPKEESKYSTKIIKNGSRIITYCHSGEAMSFIKHSWISHKRRISVIACETEPLEQGVITAKELAREKIPVTLIGDNAIAYFIKDVDMAIVGADALRREGAINKIGTSLLAQAARNAGKPFYVIANSLKIDRRKKLEIEERLPNEIYRKIINKKEMVGIKIRNPAFDITPWRYVTSVITEKGIFKASQIRRLL